MTYFPEANDVMRRAIAAQLINPLPNALQRLIDNRASLYRPLMDAIERQRGATEPPRWLGLQSSTQSPGTRRYQQSRSPATVPVVQANPAIAWLVELARWAVPSGHLGIVKSFEQYLAQTYVGGASIYTAYGYWGNPYPYQLTDNIVWYFRLSPKDQMDGVPWFVATGPSATPDRLPGISYDDLPYSEGNWFPAASSAAANVHLPVPGGSVLRVFCLAPGRQSLNPMEAAAKLAGTIQVEVNVEARHVARATW